MKKILSAVLCFALIFTSGCSKLLYNKYDPDLSIGEQIKTRHYKGHPSDFGKGELFEEIMDATDKKETGRIKDLFSDYALEQNEKLEDQINRYFKLFPEVKEKKNTCCSVSGGHNRGSTEYKYLYQTNSDLYDSEGNRWCFIVIWIEGYSEKPEMQGLHSIQLISKEYYDKHKFQVHSWDDKPGVYVYCEESWD